LPPNLGEERKIPENVFFNSILAGISSFKDDERGCPTH
jgi:hypothetical protein